MRDKISYHTAHYQLRIKLAGVLGLGAQGVPLNRKPKCMLRMADVTLGLRLEDEYGKRKVKAEKLLLNPKHCNLVYRGYIGLYRVV